MICSIINTAFANTNEPEIRAISKDQGVGTPFIMQIEGCVMVKGADLTQMNTLPSIVLPEPRLEGEADAAYDTRTAAINIGSLAQVKSASPHKVLLFSSVEEFYVMVRQDPTLIPAGGEI